MHNNQLLRLATSVFVSAIAGTCAAYSTEPADTTTLGEVTVTASRDPYGSVIPAQKLDGEQLERLNSHNVADAIRYFSGVQIKDYGGVGGVKTVDMRSMGSNHTGVFYDGIQLGNAQNGQIDLGKFSLDNIEEISMYNGQKSEVFQSAKDFGSAGSIYLRTRYPRFEAGKRTNVNVTYRTGSFGLQNPSVRMEYRLSPTVSASVNGEFTYASGRYRFRYRKVFSDGTLAWDTTATRRNGNIHAYRLEAGLFGRPERGRWMAKAYYYDSSKGIPGAIVNNVWKSSQRQWDRNFFVQGSWQRDMSDRYSLMVNAKYARDYMRYLNPDTTLMYIDNTFHQDEAYVSTANRFSIMRGWDADVSVDWQWNHLSSSMVNFAYPTRHTLLTAAATAWRRGAFKAQASVLGTFVWDRYTVTDGVGYSSRRQSSLARFTPAVFASWDIPGNTGLSLRAFYKRIFRMPTFNDLYYTDIGNASLRPEYVTQYNIGIIEHLAPAESWLQSLDITADLYHNRISDKIIAVPKGTGQYRWMMMNIGRVRVLGLDVTASATASLPAGITLRGRLNYTWQMARDYTDPTDNDGRAGTYRGQIAYIPRHSGSAVVGGSWRRLDLNYSFIYVGERYENSSNILQNRVQPWYTHDLSASWLQPLGRTRLKTTLEVNNLFNQQYEVIMNYPMPGRNFRLIFQFDL